MSEMITRVAAAIVDAANPDYDGSFSKENGVAMARAAVAAMRQPSEAMTEAIDDSTVAWECFRDDGAIWQPADVWTAMIDAALG